MPIYMDRHDVGDAITAEIVAQIHQEDLKIQDQFGCRGLTYWFDGIRKTAFCLIEAPDVESIKKMHDKAHGQVPHTVIEVDAGIVESFLGRIEDPERTKDTGLNIIDEPGFRTIMVISIDRPSSMQKDPAAWKASLHAFHQTFPGIWKSFDGSPVKQAEGHFLFSFRSVTNALQAAREIQALNKEKLIVKIGLSAGVPVTEKESIFEGAIKLAERMCKIVKGEIILSSEVKELYNSENIDPLKEGEVLFSLTQADEQFLTLLMDYTEAAWNKMDLKVDDFSKPVGCSKSQLYRKLTNLTGKSPNSFIKDYRLQEAFTLLKKQAGNISEIAFETGFNSPSYFSKCFQKRYGHLPSDYLN